MRSVRGWTGSVGTERRNPGALWRRTCTLPFGAQTSVSRKLKTPSQSVVIVSMPDTATYATCARLQLLSISTVPLMLHFRGSVCADTGDIWRTAASAMHGRTTLHAHMSAFCTWHTNVDTRVRARACTAPHRIRPPVCSSIRSIHPVQSGRLFCPIRPVGPQIRSIIRSPLPSPSFGRTRPRAAPLRAPSERLR